MSLCQIIFISFWPYREGRRGRRPLCPLSRLRRQLPRGGAGVIEDYAIKEWKRLYSAVVRVWHISAGQIQHTLQTVPGLQLRRSAERYAVRIYQRHFGGGDSVHKESGRTGSQSPVNARENETGQAKGKGTLLSLGTASRRSSIRAISTVASVPDMTGSFATTVPAG